MLDLLQNGVHDAMLKGVTTDQQEWQPVGMSDRRGGHHVGRPRAHRRGSDHDLASTLRLGECHRGQCHGLFIVPPPGGQLILDPGKRLGQGHHVAVAEDTKHAGKKGNFRTIDLGALRYQPAHDRLCRGESNCLHRHYSLMSQALIAEISALRVRLTST